MEEIHAHTSIYTDDEKYELSALIGDKGYFSPHLKVGGGDIWDNDSYLLNELWPYLKQSLKYKSDYWERIDSDGSPFDESIPDERVEELLAIFDKGIALGFFRKTKKDEKTHSRYRF